MTAALEKHRSPDERRRSAAGLVAVVIGVSATTAAQFLYGPIIANFVFRAWSSARVSTVETGLPAAYCAGAALLAVLAALAVKSPRLAPHLTVLAVALLWSPVYLHAKLEGSRAVNVERAATAEALADRVRLIDASSPANAAASGRALASRIIEELVLNDSEISARRETRR